MFNSQCLLSRKGPLGAILVAAYCFKRLKKAQVLDTDISFSVEKIQDKFDHLTYRVLAYLLLGVVRIYSRKVEYLLDEFNEVIVKFNEYVAEQRHKVETETLRAPFFSITLPESFALDAFDLEILDDDYDVSNVTPQEKITLKDVAWKTNMGLNSLEKNWYEDFASCSGTLDYDPTGDGHTCHLMDIEANMRTSDYRDNQEANLEKLRRDKPLVGEDLKANLFNDVYEEPQEAARSSRGDNQVHDQPMDMEGPGELLEIEANKEKDGRGDNQVDDRPMDVEGPVELLEIDASKEKDGRGVNQVDDQPMYVEGPGEVLEIKANKEKDGDRFSEECKNLHGENVLAEEMRSPDVGQDHQVDEQPVDVAGSEEPFEREANKKMDDYRFSAERMSLLGGIAVTEGIGSVEEENHMHPVVEAEADTVNLGTSVEKLMQHDISRIQFVEPAELIILSTEEKDGVKELMFLERESPERGVCSSEELKLSDIKAPHNRVHKNIQKGCAASATANTTPESKTGTSAATPEFMFIPTPAPKERPRFSRKRKCLFDEVIVLPNHILKKWLDDSSDLVHKRRKGVHNSLSARRISQIWNLSQSLIEPLVPCGLGLRSLFLEKKLWIAKFSGPVEPMQKVVMPESPVDVPLEPKGADSLVLPVCMESDQTVEPPGNSGMPESSSLGDSCLEPTEIAPQTPVRHSASVRSFGSSECPSRRNFDGGSSPHLTALDSSQSANQELEIGFLHKDIDLWEHGQEEDSSGVTDGWSERTRAFADYLSRVILHQGKEAGKVSLLQLLEGRTKKQSARLFYEMLVLKSKGFINVAQTDAYGDILVWKGGAQGRN